MFMLDIPSFTSLYLMYGRRETKFCSIGWTIVPPVTSIQFTQCKGKLTTSDLFTKKETT